MHWVHIWRVNMVPPKSWRPSWNLPPDEEERANRFRSPDARERWACSRVALRAILAAHCSCEPNRIRFEVGPFGKPRVAAGRGTRNPHFNLSRSGDLCLIAVCQDSPVGIDVEKFNTAINEGPIVDRFFTAREAEMIGKQTGTRKKRSFLEVWTRKEAYLKATGLGLQSSLRESDFADSGLTILHSKSIFSSVAWRLVPLNPADGFIGSLAVQDGARRHIEFRRFRFGCELGCPSAASSAADHPVELNECDQ